MPSNWLRLGLGFALLLIVCGLLSGCAPTMQDRFAQYEKTLREVADSFCDLYIAGRLDQDDVRRLNPLIQEAYRLRGALQSAAATNDEAVWGRYAAAFKAAMVRLNAELAAMEAESRAAEKEADHGPST